MNAYNNLMNEHRYFQPSDSSLVKAVFIKVRDHVADRSLFDWSTEMIETELIKSQFYLSVSADGSVEAFICFRESSDHIEILALGTNPEKQRSGAMKHLLLDFARICGKKHKMTVLEVHARNKPALALYEKCGFKVSRIRKAYYRDGSDGLEMLYSSKGTVKG